MAGEIATQQTSLSGATVYATLDGAAGRWNGTAYEAVAANHWASYAVPLVEAAGAGYFAGDLPVGIPAGTPLAVTLYRRAGGTPAPTDAVVGAGAIGTPSVDVATFGRAAGSVAEFLLDYDPTSQQATRAGLITDIVAAIAQIPTSPTGLTQPQADTLAALALALANGFNLAPTALDNVPMTPPTRGVLPNFRHAIVMQFRRKFRKSTWSKVGKQVTDYADDGSIIWVQPLDDNIQSTQAGVAQ